jgi:hypothetical protein
VKTLAETDWKVLGQGKDGKLESWMIETAWGIADSSGKILIFLLLRERCSGPLMDLFFNYAVSFLTCLF